MANKKKRAKHKVPSDITAADVWTIVDIYADDVSDDFIKNLSKFKSDYIDTTSTNATECLFSATITSADGEDAVKKKFDNEQDFQTLLKIENICADLNAFYFRIIN